MPDTYSPARLMLRGQLPPAVLKFIPARSASLSILMSPVPSSRRQTLDPVCTLASGRLLGSKCVLLVFQLQLTPEKSIVRLSTLAARMPSTKPVRSPGCPAAAGLASD